MDNATTQLTTGLVEGEGRRRQAIYFTVLHWAGLYCTGLVEDEERKRRALHCIVLNCTVLYKFG